MSYYFMLYDEVDLSMIFGLLLEKRFLCNGLESRDDGTD